MAVNRPRGREKNVTGQGKKVYRRGSGLGTGPVGRPGGRPSGTSSGPSYSSSGSTGGMGGAGGPGRPVFRSGGSGGLGKLILIVVVVLLLGKGGMGGLGSMLSGGMEETSGTSQGHYGQMQEAQQSQQPQQSQPAMAGNISLEELFGSLGGGSVSSGWEAESNESELNVSVVEGARDKYTKFRGKGQDEVTIMLYLCGTDLESRSSMATMDLQEMMKADISEKINLIIYTGGCKQWKNNVLSNKNNQVWQMKDEGLVCLEENAGRVSMTDPDTLSSFIRYCSKNFPANRNALIFWDHGGGSISGYGYDEKFASSGSMSLAEIDKALTEGGVKFDFVGYDACLMATAENALMLTKHADYMIASEEVEPGIGWYYTNWLTEWSKNTSMPTVEIGKNIIDDFVDTCARQCAGRPATLSIVDLAEVEAAIPEALADFSQDTYELIKNDEYAQVSHARSGAREYGATTKTDMVDLVHLAKNMGTTEGEALKDAILSVVKYNRTSYNMTNSYGLSIYFPLRKANMVDAAVDTYEKIGMGEEYARCIQAFASMEVCGQAASGGTTSPLPSLLEMLGGGYGGSYGSSSSGSYGSSSSSYGSSELLTQMLGGLLSGEMGNIYGLTADNTGFFSGRAMGEAETAEYLMENSFDSSLLQWQDSAAGQVISLPEEQWKLVSTLHANMFFDDGAGFIDMGSDNVYEFDENGNLLAPDELTWLAINQQPVAYYHENTVDDGENYSISGRIPVLYNGERAELLVEFTDDNPYGSVVGVRRVYVDGETTTAAKTMDTVKDGDIIDFICDYYSYEGEYIDSYMLGEQLVVDGELEISDVYVDEDAAKLTYLFTDIYNQNYWTTPVKQ
ncbi:MAG: peptidase C11 [Lachnospiraceae bacterium]|nr:peptidase C11 [Lachnospiraceae bacterium]